VLVSPDVQFESMMIRTVALVALLVGAGGMMLFWFRRVLKREGTDRMPAFAMLGAMMFVILLCCLLLLKISF